MSSMDYQDPEPLPIENEKFINKPVDKTWSALLNQLFNDTFQIQNTNKTSGTIIATFKTDRPSNYIDCGIVTRKFRGGSQPQEYVYNYADSTEYTHNNLSNKIYNTTVASELTAEITAKTSTDGTGSTVVVNVDYTLTKKTDSVDTKDKSSIPTETEEIKFSTSKPYNNGSIRCISNGTIETNILHGIQ